MVNEHEDLLRLRIPFWVSIAPFGALLGFAVLGLAMRAGNLFRFSELVAIVTLNGLWLFPAVLFCIAGFSARSRTSKIVCFTCAALLVFPVGLFVAYQSVELRGATFPLPD
jgi:hypothetical protein